MRARSATEQQMSEGNCPLDGIAIREHVRCCCCHILIGPSHYEKTPHERDGNVYCSDCIKRGKE